jgi:hypothetical protein
MVTSDASYTREIKPTIALAHTVFTKKEMHFTNKLDLNLMNKPLKCYIWMITLCSAGSLTFWKVDEKYLESSEMCCWRRKEEINWKNRVRTEVLLADKEERQQKEG